MTEPLLCMNCAYLRLRGMAFCEAPQNRTAERVDLVTGDKITLWKEVSARIQRSHTDWAFCGPDGRWFKKDDCR